MVQVDIFWSYAVGAGFALAASRQLLAAPHAQEVGAAAWWQSQSFVKTVLFLALVFVPSGAYLLAEFPSWETMHVAANRDALPSLLVTAFGLTNFTQGVLGYFVVRWLVLQGSWRLATLQWLGAYFAMFFVLVHGWDGTGYVRFFSAQPEAIVGWTPATALAWCTSNVAIALSVMGIFFLPPVLGWMAVWLRDGRELDDTLWAQPTPSVARLVALVLAGALGLGLSAAIVASLCVRAMGWIPGGALFAVISWLLVLRPGALLDRLFEALFGRRPEGMPAPAPAPVLHAVAS